MHVLGGGNVIRNGGNMRVRLAMAVVCATAAGGQSANPPRVFQLSNGNATDAREIANVVQSILAPEVDADKQGSSITVKTGPPDFVLGQWLVETLDKQVQDDSFDVDRYAGTTGNGVGVAVFRLSRKEPIQTYSEMVNAARTIPEMTDVFFPLSNMRAIVARAAPEKLEMAEWFLRHLEAGGPGSAPAEAKFPAPVNPYALKQHPELVPDHLEARILYTRERLPVQTFQEIVNAVRTIPELTKVFPVMGKGALALSGEPDRVPLAEWIFQQLDQPNPALGSPTHEGLFGDTTQIFFMPVSVTEENFRNAVNRMRTTAGMTRVFPALAPRAIVVRGTASQLNQAAEIVRSTSAQ
jgi:hypothetical protein